jgi:hypothetical protein
MLARGAAWNTRRYSPLEEYAASLGEGVVDDVAVLGLGVPAV